QGRIRTEIKQGSLKMSESEQNSDRKQASQPESVRIKAEFGQKPSKAAETCPKQVRIRTEIKQDSRKMSETGQDSDRTQAS
ncbi:hypothetical protein D3H55_23795, partial [Bacillus salacetis]